MARNTQLVEVELHHDPDRVDNCGTLPSRSGGENSVPAQFASFRWRDSRDGNKQKLMMLDTVEFIRRYLLHVLSCGFVKIRRFEFLANRNRRASLALCRTLLGSRPAPVQPITPERHRAIERRCPLCHEGRMVVIEHITARDFTRVGAAPQIDTS